MSHTFLVSKPLRESSLWLSALGREATEAGYEHFVIAERDVDHGTVECTISEQVSA